MTPRTSKTISTEHMYRFTFANMSKDILYLLTHFESERTQYSDAAFRAEIARWHYAKRAHEIPQLDGRIVFNCLSLTKVSNICNLCSSMPYEDLSCRTQHRYIWICNLPQFLTFLQGPNHHIWPPNCGVEASFWVIRFDCQTRQDHFSAATTALQAVVNVT